MQDLAPYAIAFVVLAIVIGVGSTILRTIQQTAITNTLNVSGGILNCTAAEESGCGTVAYNASRGGLQALGTFGSWQNTLAIVVVAAIVIGVVATIFYNRKE